MRARSAPGRFDERLEREVGDADGLREVEDQPADAARERRFEAAVELTRVLEHANDVDLMNDVVEPMLDEPDGARFGYGGQGL